MSCRSGAIRGGNTPCLQPLRATVPFQLYNKAPHCKDAKTVERAKSRPPRPTIRRTLSLEAIMGPYLQGHWPKDAESQGVACVNDKSTQTPRSWTEETRGRRTIGGHKRSASWGSAEHLKEVAKLRQHLQKRSRHAPPPGGHERPHHPVPGGHAPGSTQTRPLLPLSRLAPRLRRSVEGLNLELEGVFVSETPEDQLKILDVPDGHRAPVPAQRCSSGSQSDPSPALLSPSQSPCTLDPALLSPSQSPCCLDPALISPSQSPCCLDPALLSPSQSPCSLDPALLSPSQSPCCLDPALPSPFQSPWPTEEPDRVDSETLCPSPSPPLVALNPFILQPSSSSPRPNKTYSFQREPPEGCERVRVCEEAMSPSQREPILRPSCPDPNKVNFTPYGGSAFCPVSLLKPLLPSMDLLFRGLSVSPVTGCSGQGPAPCQPPGHTVGGYLSGSFHDSTTM